MDNSLKPKNGMEHDLVFCGPMIVPCWIVRGRWVIESLRWRCLASDHWWFQDVSRHPNYLPVTYVWTHHNLKKISVYLTFLLLFQKSDLQRSAGWCRVAFWTDACLGFEPWNLQGWDPIQLTHAQGNLVLLVLGCSWMFFEKFAPKCLGSFLAKAGVTPPYFLFSSTNRWKKDFQPISYSFLLKYPLYWI